MIRRHPSLQVTLSAIITLAVVAFLTAAGVFIVGWRMREGERELRRAALLNAEFLASQLQSAVAFNDRQTAHEVLSSSVQLYRDIESAAVFREDRSLLEKAGETTLSPVENASGRPQLRVSDDSIEALAPVISREGPRGQVVLRMSRRRLAEVRRQAILAAVALGAIAIAAGLLGSWLIVKTVASRLQDIVEAARRVAAGSLSEPELVPFAPDQIGHLTISFNTMVAHLRELITKAKATAATEQARLTELVDARTGELSLRNEELRRSGERYRLLVENTSVVPWEYDLGARRLLYLAPQAASLLQCPPEQLKDHRFLSRIHPDDIGRVEGILNAIDPSASYPGGTFDSRFLTLHGETIHIHTILSPREPNASLLALTIDVTRQKKLESELQQAQKLESVGRLASGVAHEINTPVQFVSDSIHFVREAAQSYEEVIAKLRSVQRSVLGGAAAEATQSGAVAAQEAIEAADLEYLLERVPEALDRSVDGLERIATIVRSMKEFAHPDSTEMSSLDLNRAIESTLIIARSEYKYVADIETDFAELPLISCRAGEINQAILNLLINAAHAIGDKVKGSETRGHIRVRTRVDESCVSVSIGDDGNGIPEAIRGRIFDPFFTTKEVGKGTGQGLAIARSVIVDKHKGELTFESELGKGTTFFIRLPSGDTGNMGPKDAVAA